jgi:hypothetical protein
MNIFGGYLHLILFAVGTLAEDFGICFSSFTLAHALSFSHVSIMKEKKYENERVSCIEDNIVSVCAGCFYIDSICKKRLEVILELQKRIWTIV